MSKIWVPGKRKALAQRAQVAVQQAAAERQRTNQLYATLAAILVEQGGEIRVPLSTLALVDTELPINAQTTETELVVTYARADQELAAEPVGSADPFGVYGETSEIAGDDPD